MSYKTGKISDDCQWCNPGGYGRNRLLPGENNTQHSANRVQIWFLGCNLSWWVQLEPKIEIIRVPVCRCCRINFFWRELPWSEFRLWHIMANGPPLLLVCNLKKWPRNTNKGCQYFRSPHVLLVICDVFRRCLCTVHTAGTHTHPPERGRWTYVLRCMCSVWGGLCVALIQVCMWSAGWIVCGFDTGLYVKCWVECVWLWYRCVCEELGGMCVALIQVCMWSAEWNVCGFDTGLHMYVKYWVECVWLWMSAGWNVRGLIQVRMWSAGWNVCGFEYRSVCEALGGMCVALNTGLYVKCWVECVWLWYRSVCEVPGEMCVALIQVWMWSAGWIVWGFDTGLYVKRWVECVWLWYSSVREALGGMCVALNTGLYVKCWVECVWLWYRSVCEVPGGMCGFDTGVNVKCWVECVWLWYRCVCEVLGGMCVALIQVFKWSAGWNVCGFDTGRLSLAYMSDRQFHKPIFKCTKLWVLAFWC